MILDGGEECSTSSNSFQKNNNKKKKKSENKRRFSNEQIRSLETKFESESTLEPRKTLQLAGELGLQPRQVAIWFQNKRARWKSKQLEQDYSVLRADYNTLASKFETMEKEKQTLIIQLQKLNDLMQKSPEEKQCDRQAEAAAENSNGDQLDSGDDNESEFAVKPSSEYGIGVFPDDDSSIKPEYFGLDEEPELPNMAEPADSSLTTPENWSRLDSDDLLHRSGSSSSNQWWDFWA